ncbi:MAG: FecR domain-containing protein [Paraglaciecola sp.]|uniref:FecR family protein n=1 Tax=Paraglaciecola sp. TaxID=1920173 RepID=UPI003265678D
MNTEKNSNPLHEATQWYYTIREPDVSEQAIIDWLSWTQASEENAKAFEKVEQLMTLTAQVKNVEWPDDNELLDDDYDGEVSVQKWRVSQKGWRKWVTTLMDFNFSSRKKLIPTFALPAMAIVFCIFLTYQIPDFNDNNITVSVYETGSAEHEKIVLDDGSIITLGAKSLISVAYNEEQRKVLLERGEAYFDVAKDPNRPFVVGSGSRTITAIGTEFNVTRQVKRVVVTVAEGKVLVEPKSKPSSVPRVIKAFKQKYGNTDKFLVAGQQLTYSQETVSAVESIDSMSATSWKDGSLQYLSETLSFVVEDINRYSEHPIRIGDEFVGSQAYSGTVYTNRIENWLDSISEAFPIKVLAHNNGDIVLVTDSTKIKNNSST